MELIRNIQSNPAKQFIIEQTIAQCEVQGTLVLAEGVETKAELECLLGLGIRYYQGYYFARPELERLITTAELNGMK